MPKITLYVVQAFDTDADGELIARDRMACISASLAKRTAGSTVEARGRAIASGSTG